MGIAVLLIQYIKIKNHYLARFSKQAEPLGWTLITIQEESVKEASQPASTPPKPAEELESRDLPVS